MASRLPGRDWEKRRDAPNKRSFKRLVTSGKATGVLAFFDDDIVGWCSAGPRTDFRSLETKRSLKTDWDDATWSVTCFFIKSDQRRRGVGAKLLAGAVDLARDRGARSIEGYPVVPTSGFGGKMPSAFVWTGLPSMFERCRFNEVADPPGKRPIYVRRLRPRRR